MITEQRYLDVIESAADKQFAVVLGTPQVAVLHGLIALAMDHPGMQHYDSASQIGREIKDWCLNCFKDMGFSDEEVSEIDTMREERDTGQNISESRCLNPPISIVGIQTAKPSRACLSSQSMAY